MPISFHLHPTVLCRIAALPLSHFSLLNPADYLKDPYFRSALFLASRSLFEQLQKHDFKFVEMPEKLQYTVRKYANRITNRTTPFGAFAGFTAIPLSGPGDGILLERNSFRLHLLPDLRDLFKQFERDNLLDTTQVLQSNPSIYRVGKNLRFIHITEDSQEKRSFRVDEIACERSIELIIKYCKAVHEVSDIFAYLQAEFETETYETWELMSHLISTQLLIPVDNLHLTGPDISLYCNSFRYKLTENEFIDFPFRSAQLSKNTNGYYANLTLETSGNFPPQIKTELTSLLPFLAKLSSGGEPEALIGFREAFSAKFQDQVIPLMKALDAGSGISYHNLSKVENTSPLLKGLEFAVPIYQPIALQWTPVHQLLLNKWAGKHRGPISLSEKELLELPDPGEGVPPSISIAFRITGEKIIIGSAGGVSATTLLGRFTPFSPEIDVCARDISSEESSANPQVRFVEISCITDGKADNISRRNHIRQNEILIRTGSTLPRENQIQLKDLYLSVREGQLYLWSANHPERIIPRLSSAYNFTRSDLPVFRFLCDLQYQGLQHHQWALNMKSLFPGLDYYPQVSFRGHILVPAIWILKPVQINTIKELCKNLQYQSFMKLAESIGLAQHFALTRHDQFLVFDLQEPASVSLLLSEIGDQDPAELHEIFPEPVRHGTVTDHQGNTYASQFIVSVLNSAGPTYHQFTEKPGLQLQGTAKRNFIPGTSWAYYKLYGPAFQSREVLQKVGRLLKVFQKSGLIKIWFFIRYNDPEPHLRLRINSAIGLSEPMTAPLTKLFDDLCKAEKIQNVWMGTYERELERYAHGPIELIEKAFYYSSMLVTASLRLFKGMSLPDHVLGLRTTYDTILLFIDRQEDRLHFMASVRDSLFAEQDNKKVLKTALETTKRTFRQEVTQVLSQKNFYKHNRLSSSWIAYSKTLILIRKRHHEIPIKLLADIIHMHINRVFSTGMRRQELVVYTLLYQYELTNFKNKKP